jgi:hypothetical protein
MKVEYKNRYGDVHNFTKTEDGDILWEGNFEWCRCGYPNVYTEAYNQYLEDGGKLSLKEFREDVHKVNYDSEGNYSGMSELNQIYAHLIYSDTNTIDMCDPSGGPYMHSGYNMGMFDESFKGMLIEKFEEGSKTSWKIIIKK